MTQPVLGDWDMTPYFPEFEGEAYQRFRDALLHDARALIGRAEGLPALEGAGALEPWCALLAELEHAQTRSAHLGSYLGCLSAANARHEPIQAEVSGAAALRSQLARVFVAVRAGIGAASPEAFAALRARPELAHAGHFLGRLREEAERSMPPELEALAEELDVTGLSAWSRLYDQVSGRLTFSFAPPGREPETRPVAHVRSLLGDPDPAVREAALRGSNQAWEGQAEVVAASLNAISGTRLRLYERRGIDDFLVPALFDAGIDRATLDAMLEAVGLRREVGRRYLREKAARLGMEQLGFEDTAAPLPGSGARDLPFEEARTRVLDAFAGFHTPLHDLALRAFERRWIDYSARSGKRPGGFCSTSPVLHESRIYMTFDGATGDVSTLAHELGHAYHGALLEGARLWERRYPMTLAETASTFAEQVVIEALLEDPDTPETERANVLDGKLADAAAFLLNLPMRFSFEKRLYEERAAGELPVSRLCSLMEEAQREWFGDALDPERLDPWYWASKLHFYIAGVRFYNFPYTFGYLLSLGLYGRARREGPSFLPDFEELLRRAGSAPAHEVVRETTGIDLATPAFWHETIDLIETDLARFCREGTEGSS